MHALHLEGKWRLRSGDHTQVLVKRSGEKATHVWLKGFLWYLYQPAFPFAQVEKPIGHRFKPDVVAFQEDWGNYPAQAPVFWAEAGQVTQQKLASLFRQFPDCHFAVAKWGNHGPWVDILRKIVIPNKRRAPVDLLFFPEDSLERFVDSSGEISLTMEEVLILRLL